VFVDLTFNELRDLVAALDQTDIAELTLKGAHFELTLRKPSAADSLAAPIAAPSAVTTVAPATAAPSSTGSAPAASPAPAVDDSLVAITSPMVGTFYRSPAPEEPPFVDVGDRIQTGQTVCIIEAMKLMNELDAEVSGEIVEILVQNSEPVEYGQPLMRVKPN
jgi:acetyl-CoA carboxylase biotin carboxyl carrier protein